MNVRYFLASPAGDILLGPAELDRPFKTAPRKDHPFLTLGDYFNALRDFLLAGRRLPDLLRTASCGTEAAPTPDRLLIRSEKHGAFYHIASLEIPGSPSLTRLALSTALSPEARSVQATECMVLNRLHEKFRLPYLPRVLSHGEAQAGSGERTAKISILVTEWFEGFHEWHLVGNQAQSPGKVLIWDDRQGRRPAGRAEMRRIIHEAARILTLYYDPARFHQILFWHHGAGDFIVGPGGREAAVRLTTARDYGPSPILRERKDADPMTALVYFFLEMTARIRVDRADGVGEPAFLEDSVLEEAVGGFLEALQIVKNRARCPDPHSVLSLLCAFTHEELCRLMEPLVSLWRNTDPGAWLMMVRHGESHLARLRLVLKGLRS